MRFWFGIVILMVAALFLLGMGKLDQTEKPGEIPVPEKNISVLITDTEGLTLNLTQFSINGQTYLSGKLGAGKVAIPLSQIRLIALSAESKNISARLELIDRSQLNLVLEKGVTAYGKLKAGTYQILLDHLKRIEILGTNERK